MRPPSPGTGPARHTQIGTQKSAHRKVLGEMNAASRRLLGGIAAAAAATAMMMPGVAFALGGPPAGHGGGPPAGHGHGGGGGETTLTNNLSVPTIMVGGGFTGVTCGTPELPSSLVTPTGDPLTGYPIDTAAYYYVQGVNTWQAQCYTDTSASVYGAWGDNLTSGDAKLSVGSPIRVELGLMNSGTTVVPTMDGYTVVKLDPNALDRESAYGTLATGSPETGFSATPTPFASDLWRVYAGGVTFSIQNLDTLAYVVAPGTAATAEINATGNVVYGYNLRVSTAGHYRITFTAPTSVTFTGSDAGTLGEASGQTAYLDITVTTGSGGGGGGGGPGGH